MHEMCSKTTNYSCTYTYHTIDMQHLLRFCSCLSFVSCWHSVTWELELACFNMTSSYLDLAKPKSGATDCDKSPLTMHNRRHPMHAQAMAFNCHWQNFFLENGKINKRMDALYVGHLPHCGHFFVIVTQASGHLPPEGYWGRIFAT